MSEFMKAAYSERIEGRIYYDESSFSAAVVFEYEDSFAEYRYERREEENGWN